MKPKQSVGNTDFSSLIAEAEKAVEKMKEPRLKEIAFERVLDYLLSTSITNAKIIGKTASHSPKVGLAKLPSKPSSKSDGPLAWVRELVDDNFFSKPKSSKDIQDELVKQSHRLKPSDLTLPLQTLCHEKKLRRDKIAPADGGKKVFHWFNW